MIRIGIFGYGNLGKAVALSIRQNPDTKLCAVFTRRDPASLPLSAQDVPVFSAHCVQDFVGDIDVLLLCGGSATDLPRQTPMLARLFHLVDSFDTHEHIATHFAAVDDAARSCGKLALISAGWDPGLLSLQRLYADTMLPNCTCYTFWGKGVSQGHSDAIRRIDGVLDAKQYTIPLGGALQAAKNGRAPALSPQQRHKRVCYVVAKEGADRDRIAREIATMPHYFAGYDVAVNFVSQDELNSRHAGAPHGGEVVCYGRTGERGEHCHVMSFGLKLSSNPEFTANVLVAFARAVKRMADGGEVGARTVLDVPPSYLSPLSADELRKKLL